ncbi:hypothetical protein FOL46_008520 [Perkinsus olseni]|nr:hypothetical protein FOL46_008520 [Perkinsus olseni]
MSGLPSSLSSLSVLEHQLEEELKGLTVSLPKEPVRSRIPVPRAKVPKLRTRKDTLCSPQRAHGDDEFVAALVRYASEEMPDNLVGDSQFERVYEGLAKRVNSIINYDSSHPLHSALPTARLVKALNQLDFSHLRSTAAVGTDRPLFSSGPQRWSVEIPGKPVRSVLVVLRDVDIRLRGAHLALVAARDGEDFREAAQLLCRWSQRILLDDPTRTYRMTCDEAKGYRIGIFDRESLVASSERLSESGRIELINARGDSVGTATVMILEEGTNHRLTVTVLAMSLHRKSFAPLGDLRPLLCLNGENPLDIVRGNEGRRASMSRVANSAELRSKAVVAESREPFTSFAIFAITDEEQIIGGTEELLIDDGDYDCDERAVEVDLFDDACENKIGLVSLRVRIERELDAQ